MTATADAIAHWAREAAAPHVRHLEAQERRTADEAEAARQAAVLTDHGGQYWRDVVAVLDSALGIFATMTGYRINATMAGPRAVELKCADLAALRLVLQADALHVETRTRSRGVAYHIPLVVLPGSDEIEPPPAAVAQAVLAPWFAQIPMEAATWDR